MRVYILVLIVCMAVELSAIPASSIATDGIEGFGSGSGKGELFSEDNSTSANKALKCKTLGVQGVGHASAVT